MGKDIPERGNMTSNGKKISQNEEITEHRIFFSDERKYPGTRGKQSIELFQWEEI